MHPRDGLPPWQTSNCNTCCALAVKISTHQKLPDSKRLAFAGLRAPSLTSRSTRQIDPSVDVSTQKNRKFNRKGRAFIERVIFKRCKWGMIIA